MIVGITGASGIQFAVRTLEILRDMQVESHLVMSKAAELTCAYETDLSTGDIVSMADIKYGRKHGKGIIPLMLNQGLICGW